jgi:hypothetical protein
LFQIGLYWRKVTQQGTWNFVEIFLFCGNEIKPDTETVEAQGMQVTTAKINASGLAVRGGEDELAEYSHRAILCG